jgi:hypothetical protein
MSITTDGWTSFSGGAGASCTVSLPVISGAEDMVCDGAASVTLTVSGGVGPYSWGTTKGQLSSATGTSTTLTPPTNPYSGSAGTTAYRITTKSLRTFCGCATSIWDCYDNKFQTCIGGNPCWAGACSCSNCTSAADAVCDTTLPLSCGKPQCADAGGCPEVNAHKFCIDATGDCQPCAVSMDGGAVVTVTDSLGQTAFVTILPSPRNTL